MREWFTRMLKKSDKNKSLMQHLFNESKHNKKLSQLSYEDLIEKICQDQDEKSQDDFFRKSFALLTRLNETAM